MRSDLPTGTVTFVFTDVEGSTRLLDELGAELYAQALDRHREVIREACAKRGGIEVDAQGDAFFFAFPTAPEALEAAREFTERLGVGSPIHVRVGLHTGTPLVTEEGYVGADVHRAARIAAAGHGGQVLVSASTAPLLGTELRDLGEHRFKDLSAPERVYQLGGNEFPRLRTLYRSNLPVPATPFLGRERELEDVRELLSRDGTRLLTLTGPGGTGKTRLAMQAAGALSDRYPDGVWWIPLAPLRDPELVLDTAALALDAKVDLAEHIAGRSLLLLFDNFEQVVDAAPRLAELLAACEALNLLVTSREPLHLTSEHEYPVPPLEHEEGVRFFVNRARSVDPTFEADDAVSEICRRLDDLPLGLELAAARVKILSSEQLLARIDERLPLLTGGARDLPERQRTLRATIEWSYDLLNPAEKDLFARLAVFSGGSTLVAAEDVTGAELDTLQSLVEKSLVRYGADRYWMLETIREFALNRLEESADAEALRERHAAFFLAFARSSEMHVTGAEQQVWLERLAAEHENLRSALDRFSETGDGETALALASSLVVYWFVRGHYGEGLAWLEQSFDHSSTRESPALAKALWGAGFFGVLIGNLEPALDRLERGLAMARRVDDPSTVGRCLAVLGLLAFFRNEPAEARTLFEESVEAARAAGDMWCLADSLGTLGSVLPLQGDLDGADASGLEGLSIARQAGDQQGIRMCLFGLALSAVRRGNLEHAAQFADEGLEISQRIGDPWFTSYFQWIRASVALDRDDLDAARSAAEESLEVGLQAGGALLVVCAKEVLARVLWAEGAEATAKKELEEAMAVAEDGGVPASYAAAVELTLGRLLLADDAVTGRKHLEASLREATRVGDSWAAEKASEAMREAG
ncbi:MAG TPA: adenylate/guanylate cyclase domain-containing protein [Gaiellaceae bacterium]|nr:adenylate/guanylate cyclase domain-containing protein [Gaiellaceae bacterium]